MFPLSATIELLSKFYAQWPDGALIELCIYNYVYLKYGGV